MSICAYSVRDKKETLSRSQFSKGDANWEMWCRSSGLWLECSEGPQSGHSEVFPDMQEHRRLGIRDARLLTLSELTFVLRNPNQVVLVIPHRGEELLQ